MNNRPLPAKARTVPNEQSPPQKHGPCPATRQGLLAGIAALCAPISPQKAHLLAFQRGATPIPALREIWVEKYLTSARGCIIFVLEQPLAALDLKMKMDRKLLEQITSDLGLNIPFVKGQKIPVKNCWHFSTDGNAVDILFREDDFIDGMNRIYVTLRGYRVVILAFCLMDTHVHFILYGEFDECNRFVHDYVRRTSWYISVKHKESHKLESVPVSHQEIGDVDYLKTVICYTLRNAPIAGIRANALDYPWSSGPLYFKQPGLWCSPRWIEETDGMIHTSQLGLNHRREKLRTRKHETADVRMMGELVFPGEYVAFEMVESLFKSCKSFHYFLSKTREEDVEARGGSISRLSIPMQEMRQHKKDICMELFGTASVMRLNTQQRILLARTMRARYNSSLKQIIRLSGLVYEEVKGMI